MNKFKKVLVSVSSLGLLAMESARAAATPVDVTDVVANITAQATPIAAVAGAVLTIHVGIKAFKWVRRASN